MHRSGTELTTLLAAAATPACADAVADFYAGKQIRFIIRTGSATTYYSYSRLLARHLGRHIPGNPAIIAVNMPGGGGIRAATYVAKVAPQDGTILSIVSQGLPVDQALGLNTRSRPTFATSIGSAISRPPTRSWPRGTPRQPRHSPIS